jgi:hypothetical protein
LALASFTINRHVFRSCAFSFHLPILICLRSSFTSWSHLFLGLPFNNCKGFVTKVFYGIRSSALSPNLNQRDSESCFWGTLPLKELSSPRLKKPPPPFTVYKPYQCSSFPTCST